MDCTRIDEAVRDLGPKVATLVNANLSAEPQIVTAERAEFGNVLSEHELRLSGTVNADSAAKAGQLTGAKVLATGRAFKAEGELLVVAKIIGTETSRVDGDWLKVVRRLPFPIYRQTPQKRSPRT